jgi:hypothetical protein
MSHFFAESWGFDAFEDSRLIVTICPGADETMPILLAIGSMRAGS